MRGTGGLDWFLGRLGSEEGPVNEAMALLLEDGTGHAKAVWQ